MESAAERGHFPVSAALTDPGDAEHEDNGSLSCLSSTSTASRLPTSKRRLDEQMGASGRNIDNFALPRLLGGFRSTEQELLSSVECCAGCQ